MDAMHAIMTRRSVRQYTGAKVSRDQLEELVKAGMSAPTAHNARHFYFMVIDDESITRKLGEVLPHAKMLLMAKHAILVASDVSQAYGTTEFPYWVQDCAAAVENVLLAATALGLGSCWTGCHPRVERARDIKSILSLPEHVSPFAVIAVGRPVGSVKEMDKFDPSRISWNVWGNVNKAD